MFFPFVRRFAATGNRAANLHLMVKKKLPRNPTLFQRGGRDSPFYKLTPSGDCGLAISSPPPCTPLLGDAHKAGNRSCEDGRGFMTRRQVWLNKAYSHLGWKPLPYLEIYDEDDTADYSRLLKRIGHGPASGRFSVCICVYYVANGSTVTQFCLICSSSDPPWPPSRRFPMDKHNRRPDL